MQTNSRTTAFITIGNRKALALDRRNNLLVVRTENNIDIIESNLGPLTQKRAWEIGNYLEQLAIHTPEI